jgi:streptomycin 6-kinase
MVTIPPDLPVVRELSRNADARPWLERLPGLVDEVRDAFDLTLGPPLYGGSCSWVAPATLPDGTAVIVKIGWPHPEMEGEPDALRHWAGRGAVRLLGHDPDRHALVLERCDPGDPLGTDGRPAAERLRTGCAVLRGLWSAGTPTTPAIEPLAKVTAHWADLVTERFDRLRPPYDPGLVGEGARLLRDLPASASREAIVHGDLNPGNILAHRGGWVAIDPKPMTGDPAYDLWPLLEQIDDPYAHPDPVRVLRERVALLAAELEMDASRIVAWCVARKVEWALWAAHHGRDAEAAEEMRRTTLMARVA